MNAQERSTLDAWITRVPEYFDEESHRCDGCDCEIDENENDFCESCLCEGDDCDGCIYCLCVTDYNARKADGTLKTE